MSKHAHKWAAHLYQNVSVEKLNSDKHRYIITAELLHNIKGGELSTTGMSVHNSDNSGYLTRDNAEMSGW
jgi:hypothetical protein